MDDCLIHIPDSTNYFDSILVKTLKKLSANVPERNERNKLWSLGENYISHLKEWKVKNIDGFWELFDFTDFIQRKQLIQEKKISLYSDVHETLNILLKSERDVKIALISNTADYVVEEMLRQFNLENIFHEIFALSSKFSQKYAKPSPLGVQIILQKLGYEPERSRALMIGDSLADIIAAKRAGIEACLIRRNPSKYPDGYAQWEYKPDLVIHKLTEILPS